jgi:hypothetical protein
VSRPFSIEYSIYYFWYVHSDFYSPIKVKEKSFDNVGMSFLLGTSIKMVFCYLILKPILHIVTYNNTIEKVNFFGMFILLLIETVLTIRILKEKQ